MNELSSSLSSSTSKTVIFPIRSDEDPGVIGDDKTNHQTCWSISNGHDKVELVFGLSDFESESDSRSESDTFGPIRSDFGSDGISDPMGFGLSNPTHSSARSVESVKMFVDVNVNCVMLIQRFSDRSLYTLDHENANIVWKLN